MKRHLFDTPQKMIGWIFVCLIGMRLLYLGYGNYTPNTADAKVYGYSVELSPKVRGAIESIHVVENQRVSKGALLFSLEKQNYLLALEKAEAKVKAQRAKVRYAQRALQRYSPLTSKDFISKLTYEELSFNLQMEKGVLAESEAVLKSAQLNLEWTDVYAPVDGYVTNLRIQKGVYAEPGVLQLTFVESSKRWIEANIKESYLQHVHEGQEVIFSLDFFPGEIFRGRVKSIAAGASDKETLPNNYLPQVKLKENWVHLEQRFPVQILFDDEEKLRKITLPVGASAIVTIYGTPNPFFRGVSYCIHWIHQQLRYFI